MELSIIIVNWNSTTYLRKCLASVFRHTHDTEFEVIVVDNASPIDDVDAIRPDFPRVHLIKSAVNLGFAGANNLGCSHSKGEFLLFLNPDTELEEPSLDIMHRSLRTLPDAGIMGCKLLNGDRSIQTSSIRSFPGILDTYLQIDALKDNWPHIGVKVLFSGVRVPVRVDGISGACMMVHRAVFEQAGRFTEDYFMYAEDIDLCYKITRIGYRNYYLGETSMFHYGGKSSDARWATTMTWKARLLYFRKNRGQLYLLAYRVAVAGYAIVRLAVAAAAFPFSRWPRSESNWSRAAKWRLILRIVLTEPVEIWTQPLVTVSSVEGVSAVRKMR